MTDQAQDFLLEIGTEELPAAAAASALKQAGPLALSALAAHLIDVDPRQISVWVTPRRIAIYVNQLPAWQRSEEIAERGPVASAAFNAEGEPTKAAEGFARAKGVAVTDLEVREYEGQQFIFAVHRKEGRPTVEVIPELCRQILLGISFGKTMRWDGADLRFSRPVRWLVTKLGEQTIEYEAAGIRSGDLSQGHRFLGGPVVIDDAARYRELLAQAKVVVDQEERRQIILTGLAIQAGKQGASFIDPAAELEEVIYLVENPSVHAGSFGEEHLRLPDKVLTTAMQSHQRYFPLAHEDGSLLDGFLYVMNSDPNCAAGITEGNERVLEGRLEDAEFSFDKDLSIGIEAMVSGLSAVVFHRKLGSLADKSARLQALVANLSERLGLNEADRKTAQAAARLAKADLVSVMVQEFPTLEGYIGSVYAKLDGYPADVGTAIAEQYLPVAAEGELPQTLAGAVLALCDKVDNIIGAFAINELPTGSRDPYGLRRAALGLAEISSRFSLDFDLLALLDVGLQLFAEQKADLAKEAADAPRAAFDFICDRIQQRLVERGTPVEVSEAARAAGLTSTLRWLALAEALDRFRFLPEFEDLHTAYFRSSKIAAKAGEAPGGALGVDSALFEEEIERELFDSLQQLEPQLSELRAAQNYDAALLAASQIRGLVDGFFDGVLVMAKAEAVRNNRLALLIRVADTLRTLGDPMRLAAAPKS